MIELLDPTREIGSGRMAYAPRPSSLKGKTVGLIENTKYNSDRLLEMIALQADLLDLKTNSDRPAEGTVIEAKLDRGRGPVATVLVQRGTLRVGDIIVAGAEMGRVRALISDQGDTVDEAGPAVPVEVLGFNGPPEAGDRLAVSKTRPAPARSRAIAPTRSARTPPRAFPACAARSNR